MPRHSTVKIIHVGRASMIAFQACGVENGPGGSCSLLRDHYLIMNMPNDILCIGFDGAFPLYNRAARAVIRSDLQNIKSSSSCA
jgi:hypothetical protein